MTTKIQKWGNSLGIRLPKAIIEDTPFCLGTEVIINKKGSEIILKPVKHTLEEIMKTIDPRKIHRLVDWGPDVGNEIIEWK
jgi:antitoxin MazE